MADRMTQAQLVTAIAEQNEVSKAVAKNFLVSLSEIATKETKKNGEFTIPGVGKLVRRESKARMGRNPATGVAIKIPAKKTVKFRVAKAMKDAIVPPKKK
jgi:DNA-binding protein HU-beta